MSLLIEALNDLNIDIAKTYGSYYVYGKKNGYRIKVTISSYNDYETLYKMKIVIIFDTRLKSRFLMTNYSNFFTFLGHLKGNKIEVGDFAFDIKVKITTANPIFVVSLFNNLIRKKIKRLLPDIQRIRISDRNIMTEETILGLTTMSIRGRIERIISICDHLINKKDIKESVVNNIFKDTDAHVRVKNIQLLISQYKNDASFILKKCLNDNAVSVQVEAAKHLGEEGAKHVTDMLTIYSGLRSETLIEMIQIIQENFYKKGIDALITLYLNTKDKEVKIKLLETFTLFGDKKCNDLLIRELDENDSDIQHQAIETLGTCGTIDAIEKLYLLSEKSVNPFLTTAINKSMAAIQSRSGTGNKGWLSVSDTVDKEGALSVSEGIEDGALSIDDEEQ